MKEFGLSLREKVLAETLYVYRWNLAQADDELKKYRHEHRVMENAVDELSRSFSVIYSTWKELMNGYLIPIGCEDSYIEFLDTVITETALWIWDMTDPSMESFLAVHLVRPGDYTLEQWARAKNQFDWYSDSDGTEPKEV